MERILTTGDHCYACTLVGIQAIVTNILGSASAFRKRLENPQLLEIEIKGQAYMDNILGRSPLFYFNIYRAIVEVENLHSKSYETSTTTIYIALHSVVTQTNEVIVGHFHCFHLSGLHLSLAMDSDHLSYEAGLLRTRQFCLEKF